jgi:hypothetical protein
LTPTQHFSHTIQLFRFRFRHLGTDDNESQYFDRAKDFQLIRNGSIDAFVTFITNPLVEGLPFLDLPEEIDQSNR